MGLGRHLNPCTKVVFWEFKKTHSVYKEIFDLIYKIFGPMRPFLLGSIKKLSSYSTKTVVKHSCWDTELRLLFLVVEAKR